MVGKSVKTENGQMASVGAIFSSQNSESMINHTSQSCGGLLTASCLLVLGKLDRFKCHLNTCGHLASLHSKRSLGNFQHQYLPKLLVNAYSYRVMAIITVFYRLIAAVFIVAALG